MLPNYFDYIFVHLRQKLRLRPELSLKFLSTLGPNPTQKARPDLELWRNAIAKRHFHFSLKSTLTSAIEILQHCALCKYHIFL